MTSVVLPSGRATVDALYEMGYFVQSRRCRSGERVAREIDGVYCGQEVLDAGDATGRAQ